MTWAQTETTTHQDHVIAHVIGATVLGWVVAGEAAHLLLDIGFLWTIYLDGEMNLLPQGVAISELEGGELTGTDRSELALDADMLLAEGREATDLKRFTAAPVECLITSVEFLSSDSQRKIVVVGEIANVVVETSLEDSQVIINAEW